MKADSRRKANGWAPCVEHDNGGAEICRARYGTSEQATDHARELIRAYINRPDLAARPDANRLIEH